MLEYIDVIPAVIHKDIAAVSPEGGGERNEKI